MAFFSMNHYTIRYRSNGRSGKTALIVEDSAGTAYLFSGGSLQGQLHGSDASNRLASRLARTATWRPVPRVAPYTIDGLRQMTKG
jgi:hypothetical protein